MAHACREPIDEILEFWFGRPTQVPPDMARQTMWWQASDSDDELIRRCFGTYIEKALRGELDAWLELPRGRLALILLCDQFTRSVYRGSAGAFAGDEQALAYCLEGIELHQDKALNALERLFFYMPLEHAESLEMQDLCMQHMQALAALAPAALSGIFDSVRTFARQHHELIERFGRFPHRNEVLERVSTSQELIYLNAAHTRWGQ